MSRDKQCRFVLTGFSQDGKSRQFAFDRIDSEHARTPFTVRADLTLIRTYGIHMQELPLLCCELLEQSSELDPLHSLTFGEERMRQHKAQRVAAAEKRIRVPGRAPAGNTGSPWRTTSRP